MKTHFEHLLDIVPDLRDRYILDLGSGRGRFLIELAKNNLKAVGLEVNQAYIDITNMEAQKNKVIVGVEKGVGEKIPYQNETFDFVNFCEVIEHVKSPNEVMREIYRVLKPQGLVYVSVPNRFGMKDQHFNMYFVNWLPRRFSSFFVYLFGKNKELKTEAGFQRLDEMHYYTFWSARHLFADCEFEVFDIREMKIKRRFKNILVRSFALSFYKVLRVFYFDSFHFLLLKS